MKLLPVGDRVVVKRKDAKEQTEGGLYVPKVAQEKSNQAIVVAVGPGRVTDRGVTVPMKLEEGMTVLVGKWGGDEVEIDGVSHLIMRESEILGVVTED